MSEEEPAWRAELYSEMTKALAESRVWNSYIQRMALKAVAPAAVRAVKAAEQRGRREALLEAADEFTDDAARSDEPRQIEILSGVAYLLRIRAESP